MPNYQWMHLYDHNVNHLVDQDRDGLTYCGNFAHITAWVPEHQTTIGEPRRCKRCLRYTNG